MVEAMEKKEYYEVEIKDFGPISNANIELKPLTMFIGPNNSGKSYASLLIYALRENIGNLETGTPAEIVQKVIKNAFGELTDNKNYSTASGFIFDKIVPYIESEPKMTSSPLVISLNELNNLLKLGVGSYQSGIIKNRIMTLFQQKIKDLVRFNQEDFKIKLHNGISFKSKKNTIESDEFSVTPNETKSKRTDKTAFAMDFEDEKCLIYLNYELFLEEYIESAVIFMSENHNLDIHNIVSKEEQEKVIRKTILEKKESLNNTLAMLLFNSLYYLLSNSILTKFFGSVSYYIPSDKTSEIQKLSEKISKIMLSKDNLYKQTSREYINEILKIDENKKTDFYNIGEEFEKELMEGSIEIKNSKTLPKINYVRQDGLKMPFQHVSSSINELSSIVLYLKHILKKGNFLIIDEPEAHLHPKNQRLYIKYIIRAVNQGLNVLITTHSDYILEQLNNLIKINKIQNEQDKAHVMKSKGYVEEDLLDDDLVNIYHFKEKENNVFEAINLEFGDFGIEESNFQDVVDDLYDETEMIDNLLTRNE
jgi:predicted ATPase